MFILQLVPTWPLGYSVPDINITTANFLYGLAELGVPLLGDPNSGTSTGAMIPPYTMEPRNQTRCTSRTAYLDDIIHRPNLHLATEQIVTRILLHQTNASASGDQTRGGSGRFSTRASGVEVRPKNSCLAIIPTRDHNHISR